MSICKGENIPIAHRTQLLKRRELSDSENDSSQNDIILPSLSKLPVTKFYC